MSLISAVTPREAPQAGVKRALSGNPTSVPGTLPAFRGRVVPTPERDIKVPKLQQGNRPNEGSNIALPYNRICPLEFLSGWTGRVAPGDVAFVSKYPPGFLSKFPLGAGTNGTATMSRVIGIDGVNRLLHGESSPDGWVAGDNVLVVDAGTSPMQVTGQSTEDQLGSFKGLDVLEGVRLDGIIKSNDEPYAFTSSGSRDAVVFNTIIQGPTICNNGYLLYDPRGNPGYRLMNPDPDAGGELQGGTTGGGTPLRTVESHPRGSIEGGYHIGGAGGLPGIKGNTMTDGAAGRVGSSWLHGTGQYDYVATFTGTFSTYPAQMFDRQVQPMNTLYVGLRAWKLSDAIRAKVKANVDAAPGTAGLGADGANADKDAYFFQLVPFASRKAYLCQQVAEKIDAAMRELTANGATDDEKRQVIDNIKRDVSARTPSHHRGEKKSAFDDDVFDAVRTEDLANMVGAWTVGRVLDVKAMRQVHYEGGPADSSFALTVDVQVCWRNAAALPGGTTNDGPTTGDMDRRMVDYGTNTVGRDGKPVDMNDQSAAKDRLSIDTFNAQFPSMASTIGPLFGSAFRTPSSTAPPPSGMVARAKAAASNAAKTVVDASKKAPAAVLNLLTELGNATSPPEPSDDPNEPDRSFFQAPADKQSAVASKTMPAAAAPFVPTPTTGAAGPSSVTMSPAAAAASPVVAAAMAAAKPGTATRAAAPRAKSPARTGAKPKATTTTTTPAASTPIAAPAPAPAMAPIAATPAGSSSSAAVAGADLTSGAEAPRRRERAAAQPSTVSAVFDSIFGGTDAPVATEAPASPTPSSGSDASGTGPKTFRRPR